MSEGRSKKIAKWGFGMAPISSRMRERYDTAVQCILDLLDGSTLLPETDLEQVSELKGMFNRCVKQDQWDWFTVYSELGEPSISEMRSVVRLLGDLRKALARNENELEAEEILGKLRQLGIMHLLDHYQEYVQLSEVSGEAGWIYILSRREEPDTLKIGMTRRSVAQRVKEINSGTGVLYPFSARAVFRVSDAPAAEAMIHERLSEYRIREDREFFCLPFHEAKRNVEECLKTEKLRNRSRGHVIWYDNSKGYGFVSVEGIEDDAFLHKSQAPSQLLQSVKPGVKVEFDLRRKPEGYYVANVQELSSS